MFCFFLVEIFDLLIDVRFFLGICDLRGGTFRWVGRISCYGDVFGYCYLCIVFLYILCEFLVFFF